MSGDTFSEEETEDNIAVFNTYYLTELFGRHVCKTHTEVHHFPALYLDPSNDNVILHLSFTFFYSDSVCSSSSSRDRTSYHKSWVKRDRSSVRIGKLTENYLADAHSIPGQHNQRRTMQDKNHIFYLAPLRLAASQ